MTAVATKPPRTEDPRHPLHRLTALLDEGTLRLISPEDDCGMLAAVILHSGWLGLVAFCFLPGAALYFCVAFLFRCPSCRRFVLVQTFRPVHPQARRINGLAAWSTIVLDILRQGRFTCMHCGIPCEVTPHA